MPLDANPSAGVKSVDAHDFIDCGQAGKANERPTKPYPDYPLTPHPTGCWCKSINGKVHYFKQWDRRRNGKMERLPGDGWREALQQYQSYQSSLAEPDARVANWIREVSIRVGAG